MKQDKKRIHFSYTDFLRLQKIHTSTDMYNYEFRRMFVNEAGLENTSMRSCRATLQTVYYYKIVNKQKYLLAKIKYGI